MLKNSGIFRVMLNILTFSSIVVSSASFPATVRAASTITVASTADIIAANGLCSLREAIINANNNAQTHNDCVAGSGNDTIQFNDAIGTATITLLGSALPNISDSAGLTIEGGGDIAIDGNNLSRIIILVGGAPLTINQLTLTNANSGPSGTGGAIYNAGLLTVTNSSFINNAGGAGGAIANAENIGTLIVANSIFSDNTAAQLGGAIYSSTSTTVTNSTFFNNSATGGASGGGIFVIADTLTVTNSSFIGNSSTQNGGGIASQGATTVTNSTFSGNTATVNGGGFYHTAGTGNITNTTFSGNSATTGGGIYTNGTILDLKNTIVANSASGGDCYNVTDNTLGANINNLIETNAASPHMCDTPALVSDPNLGTLNGSPAYFPLNSGSPAIDAGDDTTCAATPVNNTSQNGVTRPHGSHCDIGSFESNKQTGPLFSVNATEDSTDGSCDGFVTGISDCTLREAVTAANNLAGANTITVPAGTYTLTIAGTNEDANATGDLDITDSLTINGTGGSPIVRAGATPGAGVDRVFHVLAGSIVSISNITIANGTCSLCYGAGIFNDDGTLTVTNSTFLDNAAGYGGGINNEDTAFVVNSTFLGNSGAGNGGGIINANTMVVTNSTFSGNTTPGGGGGIFSALGTITITNSTFSDNSAGIGGGIYNQAAMHLRNNILANSVAGGDCYNSSGNMIATNTNNLIETNGPNGNMCGTPALNTDPNLGLLTGSPAYFPLNTGSPAIDAGDDLVCAAAPMNNSSQNGVIRPQGSHCDIGSFEYPVSASIDVIIGGVTQGSYTLGIGSSQRVNYAGLDSGPVVVKSTNAVPIIAAIRDAWAVNGTTTSFSQLMGLPLSQVSDKYVFPAYNNVTLNEQLRIGNVNATDVPSTVTVTIGGVLQGTYTLQQNEAIRINYAGLDSGPVVVDGTDGVDIIAAIREAWAVNGVTKSFVQLMGLPASQLSNKYVFPAYNNVTLNEQLRIGNVNATNVPSTVNVTIGGVLQGTYTLQQNEAIRINYAGLDSGPVVVEGTPGVNIIAAIRDAWAVNGVTTSFSQLMGMPAGGLSDQYIFPAYNNVTLNEQLRIGNVDSVPTTVTVTIGGVLQGSYDLDPDEAVRINYAGLDSGPVVIQGTDDVDIIAAIRDAWAVNGVTQSFVQLMGLPFEQLSTTYLFPAYNNVTLNEQLRFGVP